LALKTLVLLFILTLFIAWKVFLLLRKAGEIL